MKQEICIKALLEWAYGRQCVDRVVNVSFTPRGPSGDVNRAAVMMVELGCRVDTSSYASAVLGAHAPDDALIIHDTVLSSGEVYLDQESGIWTQERAEAIGARLSSIDKTMHLILDDTSLPVPLTPVYTIALLIQHAKDGTEPEWFPRWKNPGAATAADWAERDRRGRKRKTYAGPSPEEVAFQRAIYSVWHAKLGYLAAILDGQLKHWQPIPPRVPAKPWGAEAKRPLICQRSNVA